MPSQLHDVRKDGEFIPALGLIGMRSLRRPQQAYDYFRPLYELAHASDPQNRPVTLVCRQNDYTTDIAERTMDVVCINRYYGWYNLSGRIHPVAGGITPPERPSAG